MATASPQRAYQQEFSDDILLIACNDRKCNKEAKRIHNSLKEDYTVDRLTIDGSCDHVQLLKQSTHTVKCNVLMSCSHITACREFVGAFKSMKLETRAIVTGKSFKGTFNNFDCVAVKRPPDLNEFVRAVSNKITQTIYGSTKVLNDYECLTRSDIETMPFYEECSEKDIMAIASEVDDEETVLKRPASSSCFEDTCQKRLSTNTVIEDDIFVQAETLIPGENNKGSYILESFTKPKGKDKDFNPERIAHAFNRADERKLQEISKYVMSKLIPEYKSEENFLGLVNLLKLDDCRIQTKVIDTIKQIQFDNDIKSANVDHLLEGIHVALQMIDKRQANHSCISKTVPVVMNALSILYLQTLIHFDEDVSTRLKKEKYSKYLKDVQNGNQCVEYCDLIESLKKLISSLEENIGKKSCLQMGNWKEALRDENNCKKLRTAIAKMPHIEQYSCIFGIVNQLCLNKIPLDIKMTNLLKDLLTNLINRAVNKGTQSTLYPVLVLATQSIVHLFISLFHEDGFIELSEILMLYLDNPKILQKRRGSLLVQIDCLLFHKNAEIAKKIVSLFRINGCTSENMRIHALMYIERLLLTSSLKIVQTKPNFMNSVPEWHELDATLCGTFNVKLNVLLPTQECLAVGCMNDYKRKADEKLTKKNITSLEILLHLQTTGCHSNVVKLISYQVRPLPLFYIVESFPGQNFQAFLLTKRKNQDWLCQTEMETFVAEIVSAVDYLHSKNVIHRDLTTTSFSLKINKTVVLTDLKIARRLETDCTYASDWLCSQVPIRWTSPESILEDKYDRKTDIWMIGHLIYEIFTHGCHPYTELYNTDTERVLEWVVFQDLKLQKWPCIPRNIHDIVLSCIETDPKERTELDKIIERLNDQLANEMSPKRSRLSSAFNEDDWYPDLDIRQERIGEPERGLPKFFVDLKQSNESPRKTYRGYINHRKSQRTLNTSALAVKPGDITCSNQPSVKTKHSFLLVEEPVSKGYVENILPNISEQMSKDMCIYSWPPEKRRSAGEEEMRKFPMRCLVYKCQKGERLLEVASRHQFGDPSNPENDGKYLKVVLEIVKFVFKLHSENWIHRDICCRSMYMTDPPNIKVFSFRLGRMCHLNREKMSDDCILGKLFEDRFNWMPTEVLQGYHFKDKCISQYSKESDVYMLACAIYEFYKMLEVNTSDPMASDLESVPFATFTKIEILERLYEGERPVQPIYCPEWLYDMLILCWNRERSRRPSIHFIYDKINARYSLIKENIYNEPEETNQNTNNSSDDYPNHTDADDDESSQTYTIELDSSDDNKNVIIPKFTQENRVLVHNRGVPLRQQARDSGPPQACPPELPPPRKSTFYSSGGGSIKENPVFVSDTSSCNLSPMESFDGFNGQKFFGNNSGKMSANSTEIQPTVIRQNTLTSFRNKKSCNNTEISTTNCDLDESQKSPNSEFGGKNTNLLVSGSARPKTKRIKSAEKKSVTKVEKSRPLKTSANISISEQGRINTTESITSGSNSSGYIVVSPKTKRKPGPQIKVVATNEKPSPFNDSSNSSCNITGRFSTSGSDTSGYFFVSSPAKRRSDSLVRSSDNPRNTSPTPDPLRYSTENIKVEREIYSSHTSVFVNSGCEANETNKENAVNTTNPIQPTSGLLCDNSDWSDIDTLSDISETKTVPCRNAEHYTNRAKVTIRREEDEHEELIERSGLTDSNLNRSKTNLTKCMNSDFSDISDSSFCDILLVKEGKYEDGITPPTCLSVTNTNGVYGNTNDDEDYEYYEEYITPVFEPPTNELYENDANDVVWV